MKKQTKTQQEIETINAISNTLEVIKIASNEVASKEVETIEVVEAVEVVETTTSETTTNNAPANIYMDMLDAVEALETAVKALKKEAITLRALVRCIADNANNPKIGLLANAFGLTIGSNKTQREACLMNIIKMLPYYIETKSDNGTIHTTPAKLSKKADNVYLASAQTNYFSVLSDVVKNMIGNGNALLHVPVIAGKYYDSNMHLIGDQNQAKAIAKSNRETAKEAKEAAKIEQAKELLGLGEIVSLDTIGLLREAAKRCKDTDALDHIMQAIGLLAK